MDLPLKIFAAIGIVVSLLCLVGICVVAVSSFLDWRREPHARSFYEGIQHQRNGLSGDAWWFSESPETMQLLNDLANGSAVDHARERWRKARLSNKETQ